MQYSLMLLTDPPESGQTRLQRITLHVHEDTRVLEGNCGQLGEHEGFPSFYGGCDMKKSIIFAVCLTVLLFFGGCTHTEQVDGDEVDPSVATMAATAAELGSALVDKAQRIADTIVQHYGATSVQYALIDHGRFILSGDSGLFSLTEGREIAPDDMFGIGSVSKMYVTAAAMVLRDQGLIDIDKPLTTYIPEFIMADERYVRITPRMLMNHTSGLYGTHFGSTALFDDPDTTAHDNLLTLLARQPLKSNPGELPLYCNDGFVLLELLVERVSGMGYSEFIARHFAQPLGLENTKTSQDQFDKENRLVKTYMPLHEGALPSDTVNSIGTGGLYATAEELCSFAQVLMGNKPEILSKDSALAMQNEEFKNDIWLGDTKDALFARGLGWDIVNPYPFVEYGLKAVKKDGDTMLYHAALVVIPDHAIAMAVISAGGGSGVNTAFAETIIQELLQKKGIIKHMLPEKTVELPEQSAMPKDLEQFSGLYGTAYFNAEVVVADGALTVSLIGAGGGPTYTYAADGVFVSDAAGEYARFIQQQDGSIYLQSSSFITFPEVGQINEKSLTAQKMNPVDVPAAVLAAWTKRAGLKYYVVNEKPSSQMYFIPGFFLSFMFNEDFSNGYASGGARIVDENHAVNTLSLRDVNDIELSTLSGIEYLQLGDRIYIREDGMPELTDRTTSCVIEADGFAQYYTVGAEMEGKTITVAMPEGASYAVYDADDICVNFSVVSHDDSTVLPAGGRIVFLGDAGTAFQLAFK